MELDWSLFNGINTFSKDSLTRGEEAKLTDDEKKRLQSLFIAAEVVMEQANDLMNEARRRWRQE